MESLRSYSELLVCWNVGQFLWNGEGVILIYKRFDRPRILLLSAHCHKGQADLLALRENGRFWEPELLPELKSPELGPNCVMEESTSGIEATLGE